MTARCGYTEPSATIVLTAIVLAAVQGTHAQVQMPDPRQMAGIPRPVGDLPDGTVSVRLIRGQLANNIANHPVQLELVGGADPSRTATTDESGRAQFANLPAGVLCRAIAVIDGERLESQEFPAPAQGGIRVLLVATPTPGGQQATEDQTGTTVQTGSVRLGANTRFIIEVVDEAVQVYYLAELLNGTRAPINPTSPVVFELQPDAQGASVLDGSTPQAVVSGNRITVRGPFQPGPTPVQLAFQLAYSGPARQVDIKVPAPLETLGVAIRRVGRLEVLSPQLTNRQEITTRDGGTYIMASGPPLGAGDVVTLSLTGLPHHDRWPVGLALTLAGAIVFAGVWASVSFRAPASEGRRRQIEARRDQLFANLLRVEEQQRRDGADVERLATRRSSLIEQLDRIYGELEHEDSGSGVAMDLPR